MYEMLQATGINAWFKLIDQINENKQEIISVFEKNTTIYVVVKNPKPAVNHGTARREKKGDE